MYYTIKFNFRGHEVEHKNLKRKQLNLIIKETLENNCNQDISSNIIDNLISRPNRASKYLRQVITITKIYNKDIK
jgi:hypothetical protein